MDAERDIRYVVVLMMENRSFDNLLGHLNLDGRDLQGRPALNFVPPGDRRGAACASFEYQLDDGKTTADVTVDPGHSHLQIVTQLQGDACDLEERHVTMGGFAQAYRDKVASQHNDWTDARLDDAAVRVMGWHPKENVPVLSQLAREYTVCSKWFCSVPGETWPNRMFAHMGHSNDFVHNHIEAYTQASIYDILAEQGVEFAVYGPDIPQAAFHLGWKDVLFRNRLNGYEDFLVDVADTTLPKYSFVEPHHLRSVNSQHPCHHVILGDQLIAQTYGALAANPEVWNHLLFIITWDEHGGFYDHEHPIPATPPFEGHYAVDTETASGEPMVFEFNLTGARVPAVVISPWARRGHVSEVAFDHTSIIKTVFDTFGVTEKIVNNRLGARVTDAKGVGQILDDVALPPVKVRTPNVDLVRRAVRERAVRDLSLTSLDELDSFPKSLLELKQVLDARRGIDYIGPTVEGETAPQELDRLINEFKTAHITPRSARIADPIPRGGVPPTAN